jgi:nucleoside-diphosphate-sugar epimerase
LEGVVTSLDGPKGIILRYGGLYGPGTSMTPGGHFLETIRAGKLPVIGGGTGIWSFTHVDDAAAATVLAMDRAIPGIFKMVSPASWFSIRGIGCSP